MFPDDSAVTCAIHRAVSVSLGLSPSSSEASSRILRAYAAPPPPQAGRNMNLCFFDLSPDPSAPMHTEHRVKNGTNVVFRFMPYTLTLVFYGPSAETDALTVRENLFVDGKDKPRSILRDAGLYPVPPVRPPSVLYEEEGSLYRKRADLVIPVRLLDNSDDPSAGSAVRLSADLIESPPNIVVHDF